MLITAAYLLIYYGLVVCQTFHWESRPSFRSEIGWRMVLEHEQTATPSAPNCPCRIYCLGSVTVVVQSSYARELF
jgi:hypothetical protein